MKKYLSSENELYNLDKNDFPPIDKSYFTMYFPLGFSHKGFRFKEADFGTVRFQDSMMNYFIKHHKLSKHFPPQRIDE